MVFSTKCSKMIWSSIAPYIEVLENMLLVISIGKSLKRKFHISVPVIAGTKVVYKYRQRPKCLLFTHVSEGV